MGIEKKVCSFRFTPELLEKLKHYAEKENRTLSNFVETTLKDKIEFMEKNENP